MPTRESCSSLLFFFFFNDTATTEIYTLSLHDALPIYPQSGPAYPPKVLPCHFHRSEEHTSELQSLRHLVCRLLLEKKKKTIKSPHVFTPQPRTFASSRPALPF